MTREPSTAFNSSVSIGYPTIRAGVQGIVVAASVAVMLSAVTACIWRPDLLAALSLVPAWCWLIPGILSALLVWRIVRRHIGIAMLLFWGVFACGWVEEFPAMSRVVTASNPSGVWMNGESRRIVSLNCANVDRVLVELQQLDPDLVFLQEPPSEEHVARITEDLFGPVGQFLFTGDLAILSRWRLTEQFVDRRSHFLIGVVQPGNGPSLTCVNLRLTPPVSRLDFWNAGFWSAHRNLRQEHRGQLQQVMASLGDLCQLPALIVAGDFNMPPLDPAFDTLRPHLIDAFSRKGIGWGGTGTNDWPLFRVDQIWTTSRIVPHRTFAVRSRHSDHRLVICDVTWQ